MKLKNGLNQGIMKCLFLLILTSHAYRTFSNEESGLVLSGVDTLFINGYCFGFDFLLKRACTSSTDIQCNAHFNVGWSTENVYLAWLMGQGLILDLGKFNLDSIKSAPSDSLMKADLGLGQLYRIFRITPDSLQKCVGNCYILKTGTDPRASVPFRAKIKILGFNVIDSANHQIKMRFLWACNGSGMANLATSGLDTFHLDTPTINKPQSQVSRSINRALNGQYVFKVVGDRFVLPRELVGKVKWLTAWDLRGKKLGRIETIENGMRADLSFFMRKSTGVLVLKAE